MAYFTRITNNEARQLTEAELTQRQNYIDAQVAAGTTDGNLYNWNVVSVSEAFTVGFRIWTTQAAATGYQSIYQGYSPPIPMSVY